MALVNSDKKGTYAIYKKVDNSILYTTKNKVDALTVATRLLRNGINCNVTYLWYHDIWKNFDRNLLGKISLQELYKQRAQQIRDKYDEIILYYSGGADSNNVLMTFLKNKIKFEYLYVRWPFSMVGKGIYKPNTYDKTAANYWSEWDFVLKKDLDWIRSTHPEIKILTSDWLSDSVREDFYNDNTFLKLDHFHSAVNFFRMTNFSNEEKLLIKKNKKVANVWGTDKPILGMQADGTVGFIFRDAEFAFPETLEGAEDFQELFYYSSEFPLLPVEMAYQVYLYYKSNPQLKSILDNNTMQVIPNYFIKGHNFMMHNHVCKKVCYPDWNFSRFQADKPTHAARFEKDFWFYENQDFSKLVDRWKFYRKNQFDGIDNRFLQKDDNGVPQGYLVIDSPLYPLGKI